MILRHASLAPRSFAGAWRPSYTEVERRDLDRAKTPCLRWSQGLVRGRLLKGPVSPTSKRTLAERRSFARRPTALYSTAIRAYLSPARATERTGALDRCRRNAIYVRSSEFVMKKKSASASAGRRRLLQGAALIGAA